MYGASFSMALRYRLRLPIFAQQGPCTNCGRDSDIFEDHAISACAVSGDRIRRHNLVRDVIYETAKAAMIQGVRREESHLYEDNANRPGDITVRSWSLSVGKPITAFDVHVTSPLRVDRVATTAVNPRECLSLAYNQKINDYSDIPEHIHYVPLVVSTFGAWDKVAHLHLKELTRQQAGNTMRASSAEKGRLTKHLMQRLSVCLQRENGELLVSRRPLHDARVDGIS